MYIEREKTMAWHFIVLFHDIFFIDQYTTIQDIKTLEISSGVTKNTNNLHRNLLFYNFTCNFSHVLYIL